MYIPNKFKEVRSEKIKDLIEGYPLACIVAHTQHGLCATHVPLILKAEDILIGHIAIVNDMKDRVAEGTEVLCIFKGDDAYISANYYPSKFEHHQQVPTWNYQVVHISGTIHYFSDSRRKLAAVGMLTKDMEKKTNGLAAWKMSDAPKDYIFKLLDDLVVFEIHICKIQAQSKLSQNKEKRDFDAVVQRLEQNGKTHLAENMRTFKKG